MMMSKSHGLVKTEGAVALACSDLLGINILFQFVNKCHVGPNLANRHVDGLLLFAPVIMLRLFAVTAYRTVGDAVNSIHVALE